MTTSQPAPEKETDRHFVYWVRHCVINFRCGNTQGSEPLAAANPDQIKELAAKLHATSIECLDAKEISNDAPSL